MPLFDYTGLDQQGRKVSGRIDGAGRRAVMQKLQQQQIYPTELRERSGGSTTAGTGRRLSLRRKVPAADLAAATRQLATLLSAGLPLDEVLATVAEQTDQAELSQALSTIREAVLQGEALHQAMQPQQRIFPELFVNMVQVGESSGTLDQVLHRLADFLDGQAKIRARIRAALAYPILMTLVGIGVLIFLFMFVVPKITRMLDELGRALPWPTKLLMAMSNGLADWWWLFALLILAALVALRRYRNSAQGQFKIDQLLLRLPLYGQLHLQITTAWFARTLATLLQSGVPLLKSLDISTQLLKNQVLKKAMETARREVQEGGSLAQSLRSAAVFPPMLAQITAAGEKSGQLEPMFFRVAETYEHQTELSITGLLSLLEPLMILVMGAIVGFVVLAILLPIFEASQGF